MDLLPNFSNAVIEIEKLENYCLNENHPTGKYKARVFKSTLRLTARDAGKLKGIILKQLTFSEALKTGADKYGERYIVDIKIRNFGSEITIRTAWIILNGKNYPQLTTCYIKK